MVQVGQWSYFFLRIRGSKACCIVMGMTQGREGKRERGKEGGRRRKEKEEKEKKRRKKGKTLSTKCFRMYGVTSTSREGINFDLN